MLSYIGVTIDELVTTFEDSLVYSDDRVGRVYEGEYKPISPRDPRYPVRDYEIKPVGYVPELDMNEDHEIAIDVFADDEGRLHSLSEDLQFAAEAMVGFLTDYIITDEIDEEWLSLDLARGALLGLRVSMPNFQNLEVGCSLYEFRFDRHPITGDLTHIMMKALDPKTPHLDRFTVASSHYEGIFSDQTRFDVLFQSAELTYGQRQLLGDLLTTISMKLGDERCGIAFDTRKFRGEILRLAARHRMHVVPSETQH